MFIRSCWVPQKAGDAMHLIEANPWALLVSQGPERLLATNLPLLPESSTAQPADEEDSLVLVGHMARANEHLAALQNAPEDVLAVFEGPWSYVTASWYPDRQMPSTYYYTAVHCYGRIAFQEEEALDASLEDLTQRMEAPFANGWRRNEIARSEITRRFAGITGFRMHVSRVEAKFKLGQDEPLRDALAVADALASHQSADDRTLAELIREQNAGRP